MTPLDVRVLVACETSGEVRDAFLARGFDAWSCDLLPSENPTNRHILGDVREVLDDGWDLLMVAHPPCTRLCNSGVRWLNRPPKNPPRDCTPDEAIAWPDMSEDERLAVMWRHLEIGAAFFSDLWNCDIKRKAVENPIMHGHAAERIRNYRKPAQTVQPWHFGHEAFKATSFYLEGLCPLQPTQVLTPPKSGTDEYKRWSAIHRAAPSADRWQFRSRTFSGIAAAMADQWGRQALIGLAEDMCAAA